MQREQARTREVMRFRFAEKGVRMAHPGDPLVDKRGRVTGTVTSCALDSDGFLTGQEVVEVALTEPGTAVGVFAGGGLLRVVAVGQLRMGQGLHAALWQCLGGL